MQGVPINSLHFITQIRILVDQLLCHLVVNKTRFVNHDTAQKRAPGVASSPFLNVTMERNALSLKYLHRLSERNLEHIKKFGKEVNDYRSYQMVLIAGAICILHMSVDLHRLDLLASHPGRKNCGPVKRDGCPNRVGRGRPHS